MNFRTTAAVLLTCSLAIGAGCNKGPSMVHVRGTVMNKDGSPLKGGVRVVRFEPASDSEATLRKAASGEIAQDGSFELFTRRPGDGIVTGKYNVTFTVWK